MTERKPTDKYKHINHHHEVTKEQDIIQLDGNEIVADKTMIPLLKALNEAGLKTRSHCGGHGSGQQWVTILCDNIESIEIRRVYERDASRKGYNGKQEILIAWREGK